MPSHHGNESMRHAAGSRKSASGRKLPQDLAVIKPTKSKASTRVPDKDMHDPTGDHHSGLIRKIHHQLMN